MNTSENILSTAKRLERYNDLLINQCNSWLSEKEGMKNLEKRIKREKKRNMGKLSAVAGNFIARFMV